MCGIFGFNFEDKALLKKMYFSIRHRGPDDRGFFSDKNISLGHARLSIIDLSERGRQPMSNINGTTWISFNGEIYNFREMRKELEARGQKFKSSTDTETIICGYDEYGISVIEKLRGMFGFALYDSKRQKLYIAVDRAGKKPVYYFFDGKKLIFASEIKAIIEHDVKRSVNRAAMQQFLALRYTPTEQTMFDGIKKVPAGHYIEFDLRDRDMVLKKYWDLEFHETHESDEFYIEKTKQMLEEAVELRLISDVPFGVYLSGGLDSSIITGLMSKMCNEPIKTFTVGFGYETDETEQARTVAEHFSTNHTEFIVEQDAVKLLPTIIKHFDEPVADPAAIPTYMMSEKTKKHATVILLGEGADEVFGGYEQYRIIPLAQKFNFMPAQMRTSLLQLADVMPRMITDKFFRYKEEFGKMGIERMRLFLEANAPAERYVNMVSMFTEAELGELLGVKPDDVFEPIKSYFNGDEKLFNKLLLADFKTFMQHLLMKVDKMTMAHAIEARAPYLDHMLVEFASGMPQRMKVRGTTEKYVLRKAFKGMLPKEIAERKKQRFFVPINNWLKDSGGFAWECIESGVKKKHFNPAYVERIKRNYESSKLYYARQVWNMMNFEIWCDVFNVDDSNMKVLRT